MRQQVNGVFPNKAQLLADPVLIQAANEPSRTNGSTEIAIASPSPQINSKWTLVSVSILGYLFVNLAFSSRLFGKFGVIRGGFSLDQTFIQEYLLGSNPSLQSLPYDLSLTGVMWDPASDQLPPITDGNNIGSGNTSELLGMPISCTISPQVPLDIIAGKETFIGIWMDPSLLGSPDGPNADGSGLMIIGPTYSMIYDDGL